jgi:hypothetical protein
MAKMSFASVCDGENTYITTCDPFDKAAVNHGMPVSQFMVTIRANGNEKALILSREPDWSVESCRIMCSNSLA